MDSDTDDSLLNGDLTWLGDNRDEVPGQGARRAAPPTEEQITRPFERIASGEPQHTLPGGRNDSFVDLTSDNEEAELGQDRLGISVGASSHPHGTGLDDRLRTSLQPVNERREDEATRRPPRNKRPSSRLGNIGDAGDVSDGEEEAAVWEPDEDEREDSPCNKRKKGGRPPVDPATREREREEKKQRAAKEKEGKAAEREAARQAKAAAKEAEKHAKRCEKEASLRLKGSGKRAEADMRVLLDRQIPTHPCCRDVIACLAREGLAATISPGDHPLAPRASVLWRRAVPSRDGRSEALHDIPYVLIVLSAEQFVEEVDAGDLTDLLHASAAAHPGYTLGLLVVGLDHYLTTRERRDFRREVAVAAGAFVRQRYDTAVATLAIRWPGVRHHLVPDAAAAAERVMLLTKGFAQQPHKGAASFLDSFGGPKRDTAAAKQVLAQCPISHPDRQSTFYALSYVPDVGPQVALALTGRFASLGSMMAYFLDPSRSQQEKEKPLADMPRALAGSRIGPSAIKRLHALLTTDDPYKPVKSLPRSDAT